MAKFSTIMVCDSSFYICFLDDINKPHYLLRLLSCFKFVMGLIIKKEIEKSPNYQIIKEAIESHGEIFMYSDYGEILRPFLSLEEIKNGEHEVIAISYILDFRKADFIVIIDDDSPRKFLERNFPFIFQRVTGTIGLIEICSCNYKVFSKGEALIILSLINRSKFRVKEEIVNKTIEKIKGC